MVGGSSGLLKAEMCTLSIKTSAHLNPLLPFHSPALAAALRAEGPFPPAFSLLGCLPEGRSGFSPCQGGRFLFVLQGAAVPGAHTSGRQETLCANSCASDRAGRETESTDQELHLH